MQIMKIFLENKFETHADFHFLGKFEEKKIREFIVASREAVGPDDVVYFGTECYKRLLSFVYVILLLKV